MNYVEHLDKLEGKIPGMEPKDPRNKNDWKKHLQKALNNITKKLSRLNKSLKQVLRERGWSKEAIDNLYKRISNQGIDIP